MVRRYFKLTNVERPLQYRPLALGLFLTLAVLQVHAEAPAAAAEEELSEVVVSAVIGTYHEGISSMATKIPMDVRELASSLSIMNAEAIKDRNAVALTDVFNYVVGATQSQGNINGFSFRGFPNTGSYTQNIQFDGLMGATLKKAATSAANVDSLEFLKGPNGVLYGQMNPGGLLNIVTKNPLETRRSNARLSLGQFFGESRSTAPKSQVIQIDNTGPVFSSGRLFYRMVVDAGHSPNSRPGNYDNSLSIYPSLTYKWSDDTAITVKGEDSQNRRRQDDGMVPIFTSPAITIPGLAANFNPTAAYGPNATWYTAPLNTIYQNSEDFAHDYGSAFSVFFHTKISDWTMRVQTRSVWHEDVVREFTINNANVYQPAARYATPATVLRRQYNYVKNGHPYNYADANIYRKFTWGKSEHTLMFGLGGGAEGFFNERVAFGPNTTVAQAITLINPILDQYTYPTGAAVGPSNQRTYQTAFGQYFADQMKIGDRLHVSLGVRHDMTKVHGYQLVPTVGNYFNTKITPWTRQLGVVFDATPNVATYVSWSQSVKPQTTIAYDASGSSKFPPESGEQYEGGAKIQNSTKNLNLTLAYYQITRNNVVVPSGLNFQVGDPLVTSGLVPLGAAISRLDGEQQSKGYEAELQWQPMPNWQLQFGYAHSDAKITSSITNPYTVGLQLANAPKVTGNFWTRYNVPNGRLAGLGFGGGLIYVGEAYAGDPTSALYYIMPSWTRVDASIFYKFGQKYDLALNIQNLTDKRYIASAQSAQTLNVGEQRKLTLSIGARF